MTNAAATGAPFEHFLHEASRLFNDATLLRGVRDLEEYSSVTETRRYYFDILDRVEMLAYSFTRLKELSQVYRSVEDKILQPVRSLEGTQGTFHVPEALRAQQNRLVLEARCLTSYLYYEVAGLAIMLEKQGISLSGELAYMIKARNFFIAHPQPRGALRKPNTSLQVTRGGLLHTHAINSAETDPKMTEHYLGRPFDSTMFDHASESLQKNRELLIEGRDGIRLSNDETARLKVFGVPEPDLDLVQDEITEALSSQLLPKISRLAKRPLPVGR